MKKLNSERESPLTKADKKTSRVLAVVTAIVLCFSCCTVAYAADDPLAVINNLSTFIDRKSTRLNSSHITPSRMPSSA